MGKPVFSLFPDKLGHCRECLQQPVRCGSQIKNHHSAAGRHQLQKLETTRYVISLLHLERKLGRNMGMQEKLPGIRTGSDRLIHFIHAARQYPGRIAEIYFDTISTETANNGYRVALT